MKLIATQGMRFSWAPLPNSLPTAVGARVTVVMAEAPGGMKGFNWVGVTVVPDVTVTTTSEVLPRYRPNGAVASVAAVEAMKG